MRNRQLQLMLLWFVLICSATPQTRGVRLDSSDWWSYIRQEELRFMGQLIKWQNREPAESNFQISGLTLGRRWDFSEIRSKFGESSEVERGDAASGRDQICYVSPSGNVHLIFELGEVNAVLYLFRGGAKWNGSDLCARSPVLSASISTASGLKLGIAPEGVKNILGAPNIETPSKLAYYFGFRKKATPEDLSRLREENPSMSDTEFRQNFEYFDVENYIEARFTSGKLTYLAISKSETY